MPSPVRVAIIDLYNRTRNEGMRALRELITAADGRHWNVPVTLDVFETRFDGSVPDESYDIVISSGGPGSPFEGEGTDWEAAWFDWVDSVWQGNRSGGQKRFALFICHSFQMMVRHFGIANVTKRRSESFGIFPVHMTGEGAADPLLAGLHDPFYAADFRNWQVVQPNRERLTELGGQILAREKIRHHVPLERAVMAIRMSPEMVGVQFHPEADPPGMSRHFRDPVRRRAVLKKVSRVKYERIMHRMEDPAYLGRTYETVIPGFLKRAVAELRPELVGAALTA